MEKNTTRVVGIDSDDPERMELEARVIPGGWYARSARRKPVCVDMLRRFTAMKEI